MIAALVCSGALPAAPAAAEEPCATAAITPKSTDPAKAYAEGRHYAEQKRYAEARGIYGWLLLREPNDREAMLAFARLDAWDGCYARAEERLRKLLQAKPGDVEARAGLIDTLIWSARLHDAMRETEAGLALDPKAAELWRRHATLLNWSGQRGRAIESAELAVKYQPDDVEIKELRDRLYLTQLRLASRVDVYSRGYLPDIYTESVQLLRHIDRFELAADAQLLARIGGTETVPGETRMARSPAIIDGLYSLSATYHFDGGYAVGASPGFGAPAKAIPRFIAKGWLVAPVGTLFTTAFTYSFWHYENKKEAHIFAPAVGYALSDEIQLEARLWASLLVLPRAMESALTNWVFAVGGRAMWRVRPKLMLGAGYTYGPQLDTFRTPLVDETSKYGFLKLTSHIVSAFGDWLVTRDFGLQPLLAFEHRTAPSGAVALVYSAEIGAYLRW